MRPSPGCWPGAGERVRRAPARWRSRRPGAARSVLPAADPRRTGPAWTACRGPNRPAPPRPRRPPAGRCPPSGAASSTDHRRLPRAARERTPVLGRRMPGWAPDRSWHRAPLRRSRAARRRRATIPSGSSPHPASTHGNRGARAATGGCPAAPGCQGVAARFASSAAPERSRLQSCSGWCGVRRCRGRPACRGLRFVSCRLQLTRTGPPEWSGRVIRRWA